MKKAPHLFLLILVFFISLKASAQEAPDFVQFFVNAASLNSSYVAIDGQPAVYFSFRKQWAGMPEGPKQVQFSIQAPLKKGVLAGFTAYNNTRGLLSTSNLSFTGGYQVKVGEEKSLRFGLSLGGSYTMVDVDGANTRPDDPQLLAIGRNSFYLQGNAGLSYHSKTFHAGIALPQFFQPSYTTTDGAAKIDPLQSVILHASNRFYFNLNKNVFEPYAIYRLNGINPSQFELAAVVHLQSKVWMGASFRQGLGPSALAGIKANRKMSISYSYTAGVSKESQMPRPSHEFHIGLLLGKRDKNATGIYSFVNTDKEKKKKTASQLAADREALAKKYKNENVHNEVPKPVEKPVEKPIVTKKDSVVAVVQPRRDSVAAPVKPLVERHEFVKRGNNKSELPPSNYVIVGAFRSEVNARRFSQDLHLMDIEEANYGFITVRGLWYVYLASADNLATIKADRDKYRHEHMFKDAWILTVQ